MYSFVLRKKTNWYCFLLVSLSGIQLAAVQCDPNHLPSRHPLAFCSISHPITLWTWGRGRWWEQGEQRKHRTGNEWLNVKKAKSQQHYFCFVFAVICEHLYSASYRRETLASVNTLCQTLLLLGRQLILSPTPSTASFRPSLTSWCHFLVAAHFSRWRLGTVSEWFTKWYQPTFFKWIDFKLHYGNSGSKISAFFCCNFRK